MSAGELPNRTPDVTSSPANIYDYYVYDQTTGRWLWYPADERSTDIDTTGSVPDRDPDVISEPANYSDYYYVQHAQQKRKVSRLSRPKLIDPNCTAVGDWHDPDQEPLRPCEIIPTPVMPMPRPIPSSIPTPTTVVIPCQPSSSTSSTTQPVTPQLSPPKPAEVKKIQKKKLGFFARILKLIVQLILDFLFKICEFFIWILNYIEN